jgi:hypothetical protein
MAAMSLKAKMLHQPAPPLGQSWAIARHVARNLDHDLGWPTMASAQRLALVLTRSSNC